MPNLILGKLARRASPDELIIGENTVRQEGSSIMPGAGSESTAERLKRQIDDSRYNNRKPRNVFLYMEWVLWSGLFNKRLMAVGSDADLMPEHFQFRFLHQPDLAPG